MSAEDVHHRLVLAIETTATSSSAFSAFREIALERLITQLALVSFEVCFHQYSGLLSCGRLNALRPCSISDAMITLTM